MDSAVWSCEALSSVAIYARKIYSKKKYFIQFLGIKSCWRKVLVFDTLMVKTTKKLQVIQKFLQTSYTGIIFFVSKDASV